MSVENIPLEKSLKECVEKAAVVLERGGVILYPTDTLYGLGADSLNKEALEKIYAIKGRDEGKPIHSIVASLDAASAYGEVNDAARTLGDTFFPGPLTLLLQKKESVPEWAVSGRSTFGIRIPNNIFCIELARAFGKPYTATSANTSGMKPERNIEAILQQLGDRADLIDLIIDAGELPESLPSTVVTVESGQAAVVREGAIQKIKLARYI